MFIPENEMGVIVLFSQQIIGTDFEIIRIGAAFPDAIVKKKGIEYRVEFEFAAANFKAHRHDPMLCDLIICWQNNYPDSVLPVLELRDDGWRDAEIILPTQTEREIDHWRTRAVNAETDNARLRREKLVPQHSWMRMDGARKRETMTKLWKPGIGPTELAQLAGVTKGYASKFISGRVAPTHQAAYTNGVATKNSLIVAAAQGEPQ